MVATGLEAAAAAASLIALTNLILTKVVPALGETRHVDDGIRRLHREIDGTPYPRGAAACSEYERPHGCLQKDGHGVASETSGSCG